MILDFIDNPRFVLSLFDEIPRLGMVEGSRLGLNRDGPTLEIELLSSVVPEKMPEVWGATAKRELHHAVAVFCAGPRGRFVGREQCGVFSGPQIKWAYPHGV